jgi:phage tail-like protein
MNFRVALYHGAPGSAAPGSDAILCEGAFSDVSGLEATMSVKTLKEGGRNWGEVQLAGPTTFSPVICKRGVTATRHMWDLLDFVGRQAVYNYRLQGRISVFDQSKADEPAPLLEIVLTNVLPTKFKGPELSATSAQVAVEELHLVHEGMEMTRREFAAGAGG